MKLPASKLISAPCNSFVSVKATPSVWGKDPLLCGLITLLLSLLPSILVVLNLFLISRIPSSTITCSGTFAVYPFFVHCADVPRGLSWLLSALDIRLQRVILLTLSWKQFYNQF